MALTHNLGFPRIGANRELKFGCEAYWRGELDAQTLAATAQQLRDTNSIDQWQSGLDLVPCGDFSLYDQVLDTSFLLGNVPARFGSGQPAISDLDRYFLAARGASQRGEPTFACEMTKWFDTNYHYLVPEFSEATTFSLQAESWLNTVRQTQSLLDNRAAVKPVLLGPLSYLWLGKSKGAGIQRLDLLPSLLAVYQQLLHELKALGVEWVQIDEPILALDLPADWLQQFEASYHRLQTPGLNLLLATYFGPLADNLSCAARLPVAGLHLDAVRGRADVPRLLDLLAPHKVLSLGVIDGRNVWKSDLNALLDWLEPIHARLQERLWLAPSCSLLHVPVDLAQETEIDPEIKNWLAFARQKLTELHLLKTALNGGRGSVAASLARNALALASRAESGRVHDGQVQLRLANIKAGDYQRSSPYRERAAAQGRKWQLPLLPTTTIGSFPQTAAIRTTRAAWRQGRISDAEYQHEIRAHICHAIAEQEAVGLDVLVHGEAERNDMVEYFAEQLSGFAITRFGWVQSYGSRCVKPAVIYGDISRPQPLTLAWTAFAQSQSSKPVKGMLTGPVTMLQWSFVRDDQPRQTTATQLALALRDEVLQLQDAGIGIIQVDEPALREGLPLRQADWQAYLDWAVAAFHLSVAGVRDESQIHTHMCYSEFNDILPAIARLDADVLSIETARSDMELLGAFGSFNYEQEIGPGVYDIHSPNPPQMSHILNLLRKAQQCLPAERLWVNPDCGLKTRQWEEVRPALATMVAAARQLRQELATAKAIQRA